MKTAFTIFISLLLTVSICEKGNAQQKNERFSFSWNRLPLRVALDSLMKWYSKSIVYLDDDVEKKEVFADCSNCGFDQALSSVLQGTSLFWIQRGNQIILKQQEKQIKQRYGIISGVASDSISGEWIQGANVILQTPDEYEKKVVRRWCPTNAFGFFSLPRVPSGRCIITVRAIGYQPYSYTVESAAKEPVKLDVLMVPKAIVIGEMTIEGSPSVLASAEKYSRGVYHRSVPSDKNQYLLDGGRIYNPAHFGSTLTAFSPEALADVQVSLGGLPPSFGGRVGGIMDLSLRDGSRRRIAGSAGISTLGAQFSFEGPLGERTTFLTSGRRGFPDAAWKIMSKDPDAQNRTFISELTSKLTHRLSGSDQISLSVYYGRDDYRNEIEGEGTHLNNEFSWGNSMIDFRWIGVLSQSMFMHASAVYSRYDFNLHHLFENTSFPDVTSDYVIEDFTLSAHAESYYDEEHTFMAGIELTRRGMDGYIGKFSSQLAPLSIRDITSWELSVYLQDRWKLLPRVTAELGGRFTSYMSKNGNFSAIDPRFSLLARLSEQTRAYTSISAINQFIHPYRNSGVFLIYPTMFWYSSTDKLKPATSLHATLGAERSINDDEYIASAEMYFRTTNNLHEFFIDSTQLNINSLEDAGHLGSGRTYGLSCSFKKRTGILTGSVTYNLSWSFEKFEKINEGREFAPPFDRRHELQAALSLSFFDNWRLGALCIVASGYSYKVIPKTSTPSNRILGQTEIDAGMAGYLVYDNFIDVNGSRLPGFQRLEFSIQNQFSFRALSCQFSLRLMNEYGLVNPFAWRFYKIGTSEMGWNAELRSQRLFPLYPVVDLLLRF